MTASLGLVGQMEDVRHSLPASAEEEKQLLNPRQYQSQLFEKAKTQNVIACLGTGSGKTLIAVMLLKHMFNLEVDKAIYDEDGARDRTKDCSKRVSLFLVNRIPLVRQQSQVLLDNSYLRVAELHGDATEESRLLQPSLWDDIFRRDKYDVVVSTAQVILDALIHAFVRIEEINCIIFDEAHHAYKSDPYARIMQCHYSTTPDSLRPKIFGMTASPLKADGDFDSAIVRLEKMLDAKVFTASLSLRKELATIIPSSEEHIIEYDAAHPLPIGGLTQAIAAECKDMDGIKKPLGRMSFNDIEYGPLVSDLAWQGNIAEFESRIKRKLEQAGALDPECDLLSVEWIQSKAMEKMTSSTENSIELTKKTKYVRDAAVNSAICSVIAGYPPMRDDVVVDHSNASPKILQLIDILRVCGSTPALQSIFCCIMFVQRQQTAIALTELLRRIPELKSWLRPEWLIGHNSDYGAGMDPKAQADTLRRFGKAGSTNLLIATSVAEEGLDISPCNYVIRFDPFDHHAGYLQSKGRARYKRSLFIILVERENEQHLKLIRRIRQVDEQMYIWLRNLPSEQGALASMDDDDVWSDSKSQDELDDRTIKSPSTGACLRPVDCVGIVCMYVALLGRDEFSPQKPEFLMIEIGGETDGNSSRRFCVELRFPANAKLRIVKGTESRSKRGAARLAAFAACEILYELGELDSHLLPKRSVKVVAEPVKAELKTCALHAITRRIPTLYANGIPRLQEVSDCHRLLLHAILIHTEAVFPRQSTRPVLVLFTSEVAGLPEVELFLDVPRVVAGPTDSVEIELSGEDGRAACRYSYYILSVLGRHNYAGNRLPYLILPVVEDYLGKDLDRSAIDWTEVNRSPISVSLSDLTRGPDWENIDLADLVVFPGEDVLQSRLYEALFLSRVKESNRAVLEEGSKHDSGVKAEDSMFVEVLPISRRDNLLDPSTQNGRVESKTGSRRLKAWMCKVAACSASFLRSCTLLPFLLERYDQVLLARQLQMDFLGQHCVNETALVQALTLTTAMQAFDNQRLEFYGDCYLKLLTTSRVFAKCDSHREGDLNMEAKLILSNTALLKVALAKNIASYATNSTVNMRFWCPPLLVRNGLSKRREATLFSDKIMADLVEAILGAAWASTTDQMDLTNLAQCALRLELLGPNVDTNMSTFHSIFAEQVQPKEAVGLWSTRVEIGTLTRLQEHLGYIFNSPHLALEAVTHPSSVTSMLPSYERLEYLGDAVLDYLVVSFFKQQFPHLDEGEATALKGDAICNASLAVLCVDVELHRFLIHGNKNLAASIASSRQDIERAREEHMAAKHAVETDADLELFWLDLKPCKVLADLVESMLGAVFIDAGFDIAAAKKVFDEKYLSHFQRYFRPQTSLIRSAYQIVHFLASHDCREWDLQVEKLTEDDMVRSSLLFHGIVIARQNSRGNRASSMLEIKDNFDKTRLEAGRSTVMMDGRSIKAVLQACLPDNLVRDSEAIWEEGKEQTDANRVDLKVRNRYGNLHALCTCRRLNPEQDKQREDKEEGEEDM